MRTKNPVKAKKNWGQQFDSVVNLFNDLWPGVPLKVRVPRQSRRSAPADQSTFFVQHTIPTSMLVAYIWWTISHAKRQVAERSAAVLAFRDLLQKMISTVAEITLYIKSPDGWKEITVDSSLALPVRQICFDDWTYKAANQARRFFVPGTQRRVS